jgi:uncharacterized protein (DUF58 family)
VVSQVTRKNYYAIAVPIAVIVYAVLMFVTHFNTVVLIVGVVVIALIALGGRFFAPNPRRDNRPGRG